MQDHRCLRLIPIIHSSQTPELNSSLDAATIEAMVTQVLAAKPSAPPPGISTRPNPSG